MIPREMISEWNPNALTCDGLDDAIVGVAVRCAQPTLVVYDVDKVINILMKRDGMDFNEAWEHFERNIEGAWVGENTPVFLHRLKESA